MFNLHSDTCVTWVCVNIYIFILYDESLCECVYNINLYSIIFYDYVLFDIVCDCANVYVNNSPVYYNIVHETRLCD